MYGEFHSRDLYTKIIYFEGVDTPENNNSDSMLASVSFWPLLIIESVARVSQHVLSRTICSLSRYNVKGELDCFNCKTGVFLRLFTLMFTITIHVFGKKINSSMGI